ncbi:unannotated protein [freshwater metagenome]|uniref:Unannotated protein n=1 Tax=freshwater metagenome TaxID=449393 RepID=A0A6J5YTP4_9ZZZZ
MTELSTQQVRDIAVRCAGLGSLPSTVPRHPSVPSLLEELGAIQLDTISTLARSHELVVLARLGAIEGKREIESKLWTSPPTTFEYWSHAACILPLSSYPWFAFRRRSFRRRGIRWHDVPSKRILNNILKQLSEGPSTANNLGGAKRPGPWWDWSEVKIGVEWLLDIGDVVCTSRTNWRREYQLADESLLGFKSISQAPKSWITTDGVFGPTDDECLRQLLLASVAALGVGTLEDVIDVHRLSMHGLPRKGLSTLLHELVEERLIDSGTVAGWSEPVFIHPNALHHTHEDSVSTQLQRPPVMLSPFDQLIWNRERLERIFAMRYRIEAYTPAAQRVFGYFAMPVLYGQELIARVDPNKERKSGKTTFIARTVTFEKRPTAEHTRAIASAIISAGSWINADAYEVEVVSPASARSALVRELNKTPTQPT